MNTSPKWDSPPQSSNIPHNILRLAKEHGFVKADGDVNKKAIADAAAIADTTFYRNIERPEKFTIDHLDSIAELFGVWTPELFKAE